MATKLTAQSFFPPSVFGKMVACFGYVVTIGGGYLIYAYANSMVLKCFSANPRLQQTSLLFSVAQLLITILTFWLTFNLRKYTNAFPAILTFIILCVLGTVELLAAMGFAFAGGTLCSV